PMASMYLLQNPDHYTSHTFKLFWWKSHVPLVWKYWQMAEDLEVDDGHHRLLYTRSLQICSEGTFCYIETVPRGTNECM
ncbi:hypothetical protein C8J57DRAFT_1046420, partial [Mycena rebaudengoi]